MLKTWVVGVWCVQGLPVSGRWSIEVGVRCANWVGKSVAHVGRLVGGKSGSKEDASVLAEFPYRAFQVIPHSTSAKVPL
jgi:hypothetical protein